MLPSELSMKIMENADSAHLQPFLLWGMDTGAGPGAALSGEIVVNMTIGLVKPEDLGGIERKKRQDNYSHCWRVGRVGAVSRSFSFKIPQPGPVKNLHC